MSLRHAAHAVWDCQYHLVWIPKRRRPVLQGEIAQRLGGLLEEIAAAYDIELLEMHIASDHVHLLCAIPPRLSVSQSVKLLKSLSARSLLSEFPHLRGRLYGGAFWAGGYFVRTVGSGVDASTVQQYILAHMQEAPEPQSP